MRVWRLRVRKKYGRKNLIIKKQYQVIYEKIGAHTRYLLSLTLDIVLLLYGGIFLSIAVLTD